jgi:hypothetical protein
MELSCKVLKCEFFKCFVLKFLERLNESRYSDLSMVPVHCPNSKIQAGGDPSPEPAVRVYFQRPRDQGCRKTLYGGNDEENPDVRR